MEAIKPVLSTDKAFIQVVIVGAGMDVRAYRLPFLFDCDVYEMDCGPVLSYKADKLRVLESLVEVGR